MLSWARSRYGREYRGIFLSRTHLRLSRWLTKTNDKSYISSCFSSELLCGYQWDDPQVKKVLTNSKRNVYPDSAFEADEAGQARSVSKLQCAFRASTVEAWGCPNKPNCESPWPNIFSRVFIAWGIRRFVLKERTEISAKSLAGKRLRIKTNRSSGNVPSWSSFTLARARAILRRGRRRGLSSFWAVDATMNAQPSNPTPWVISFDIGKRRACRR